jgi:translation initiation factor IF-2
MLELKADGGAAGEAVVVESTCAKGLGNVADCVVRWGTLRVGDYFVVGSTVRAAVGTVAV